MTDYELQANIDATAKAPRITPADIEANISGEYFFTAADGIRGANDLECESGDPLTLLTFCVIELRNGFTVTGESACASPENFNAEIGRQIARKNAVEKIWPLLGYALRTTLWYQQQLLAERGNAAEGMEQQ